MNIQEKINEYIDSQTEAKRNDMMALHQFILELMPNCKLWFLDGKNAENKVVSNPNIGYGFHTLKYADGSIQRVLSNWIKCKHKWNFCLHTWY
jgi:hypothetical protein